VRREPSRCLLVVNVVGWPDDRKAQEEGPGAVVCYCSMRCLVAGAGTGEPVAKSISSPGPRSSDEYMMRLI
jgi:hypothetical protein